MPNPSFLIATYLWRHGDVAYAHKDKKLNLAAQWYLLGTHEIFDPLQESNRFKSFRKAALCLAETGKLQEADQVMERCVDKDCAKNNFVRFYIATMRKDEAQGEIPSHPLKTLLTSCSALQSLEAMSKSTDVDSQILLWAGKAAGESAGSSKIILSAVLKCILEIGKRDSNVIGIDLLLVIRWGFYSPLIAETVLNLFSVYY